MYLSYILKLCHLYNQIQSTDNQIEVIHNNMGHVTNAVINLRSQAVICLLSFIDIAAVPKSLDYNM